MKIDIYNHVMPMAYLEQMKHLSKDAGIVKRMLGVRLMWDIEARVQMLERFPDVQQALTLGLPAPELLGGPELSPGLAQIANDGMAEIRDRWPKKFPAFVASLPMNNVPAALEEMDRAVTKLGACGIQFLTNVNGRPLDDPEFFPLFERITNQYGLPIWMHPYKSPNIPDYPVEAKSEYEGGTGLAARIERRDGPLGLFRDVRSTSKITNHHSPLRRNDSAPARPRWPYVGRVGRARR